MKQVKYRAWEKNLEEIIPVHNIDFDRKMINTDSAWRLFDEIELMQWTGLKDKNGNEIYEGDILKNNELWEVIYVPTLARFMMRNAGKTEETFQEENMSVLSLIDFEVVGNAYEMPDWDF
jgi:uncharacterized phage protein (TIGR01671 family)